jgi:PhnB protein
MKLNNYLNFKGECEAAFKFYQGVLGGEITAMFPFGGTPMAEHSPADFQDKIMHASLTIGDQVIMGSDAPPDRYNKPQGFSVSINVEDPAEAERLFAALASNGQIQMPIQQTFWAKRFGMLEDQFGIPWMVNCE